MEHILLDYNIFKKEDYTKIMVDLETLELKDIDILNNGFIDKIGIAKSKNRNDRKKNTIKNIK